MGCWCSCPDDPIGQFLASQNGEGMRIGLRLRLPYTYETETLQQSKVATSTRKNDRICPVHGNWRGGGDTQPTRPKAFTQQQSTSWPERGSQEQGTGSDYNSQNSTQATLYRVMYNLPLFISSLEFFKLPRMRMFLSGTQKSRWAWDQNQDTHRRGRNDARFGQNLGRGGHHGGATTVLTNSRP